MLDFLRVGEDIIDDAALHFRAANLALFLRSHADVAKCEVVCLK